MLCELALNVAYGLLFSTDEAVSHSLVQREAIVATLVYVSGKVPEQNVRPMNTSVLIKEEVMNLRGSGGQMWKELERGRRVGNYVIPYSCIKFKK